MATAKENNLKLETCVKLKENRAIANENNPETY